MEAAAALLVAACTTAPRESITPPETERVPQSLGWIAPSEAIVAIESPRFIFSWQNTQRKFTSDVNACAVRALIEKHPEVRVVPQAEFARVAFPDLPAENAPLSPESMKLLAEGDVLRERIAPLNVRYLLYASAVTEIRNEKAFGAVIGGGGAGAAIGGEDWDKQSDYSLAIFDLKTRRSAGSQGSASGHGWYFVALVLVPLAAGWSPATEVQACHELGDRVLATLESMTPKITAEP